MQISLVLLLALLVPMQQTATGPQEPPAAGPALADLTLPERLAILRLREARAAGDGFTVPSIPDFDPSDYPSVIYEPGAWAVATGFAKAPPGFAPIEGVEVARRPVWHAPAGTFTPPLSSWTSPVKVWGEWAVVAQFEPPDPLPAAGAQGRISGEEWLANYMGDAYLLYLMQQRKATTPFVSAPKEYPDSADLIALTSIQQRLILRAGRMHVTEKNLSDWHTVLSQLVAVTHERWRILGADLAARERAVEVTDGARQFVLTLVPRLGLMGGYEGTDISQNDPTFHGFNDSAVLRSSMSFATLITTPDSPVSSRRQIAVRAAELINLIEMLKPSKWRSDLIAGTRPLIDVVAEAVGCKTEEEGAHLQETKAGFGYDLALTLARSDLETLRRQREQFIGQTFPPGKERLELSWASPVPWQGVTERSFWLGEGRWLLVGEQVKLDTPGLMLSTGPSGWSMLAREGEKPGTLAELVLLVPEAARLSPGPAVKLAAKGPSLDLSIPKAGFSRKPDGTGRFELP